MATVKGQNLRVLVGVDTEHLQCIAASTNCVLHCALQVEEDTTKDTTDDWIEPKFIFRFSAISIRSKLQ